MSAQDENEDIDLTTNDTTDETTVEESQSTSEDVDNESEHEETPAERFKNQRAEENRRKREALEKVPKLEAELEFNKFLRKNPEAEDYEDDIKEFRAKNPTI
jgi:hypothetical protein